MPRGKLSAFVVEPPEDIFFLLAGRRMPMHDVKRRYAQAVFARTSSVTATAKILQVTTNTVRDYVR